MCQNRLLVDWKNTKRARRIHCPRPPLPIVVAAAAVSHWTAEHARATAALRARFGTRSSVVEVVAVLRWRRKRLDTANNWLTEVAAAASAPGTLVAPEVAAAETGRQPVRSFYWLPSGTGPARRENPRHPQFAEPWS